MILSLQLGSYLMIPFFKKTNLPGEIADLSAWYAAPWDARHAMKTYFESTFFLKNFFATKSCSQSLELALMAIEKDGRNEVILPSYAFVSLANAVVMNGFKCVFVDCDPDTMNISAEAVEAAMSDKTRAVILINYCGVACNYERLSPLCTKNEVLLLEDNAHGIRAKYKGQWLGSFGDISTISFDYLKNISCNEGGGIAINNTSYLLNFERAYHFGTNRAAYLRGEAPFYEWKGVGSNVALAEHLAVILLTQLKASEEVIEKFICLWKLYYTLLQELQDDGYISLSKIPIDCSINGHMFWIKVADARERAELISHLSDMGIQTAFHYTALHNSEFGKAVGVFVGEDVYTTRESQRLLRLPLYHSLTEAEALTVVNGIKSYYARKKLNFKC